MSFWPILSYFPLLPYIIYQLEQNATLWPVPCIFTVPWDASHVSYKGSAMKRTPIQRKTPLRARSSIRPKNTLSRKIPLPAAVQSSPRRQVKIKSRPAPSKDEQLHLRRLVSLGCIICYNLGFGVTPPEHTAVHHVRDGQGVGQRASHKDTLPLCPPHHQTGGYGVALHAGQEEWERRYGTERQLLRQVRMMLGEPDV